VPIAAARLEAIVHDGIAAATGIEPKREGDAWRAVLPSSGSVFDIRALVVTIRPHDDGSEIEATMKFDATVGRIGASIWLVSTIAGIPIALAWRGLSIRNAKRLERTTFDALWSFLARSEGAVYR